MLFNNHLCRNLTPEYVNSAPGLALHRFRWVDERKVGGLPKEWNYSWESRTNRERTEARFTYTQSGGRGFRNTRLANTPMLARELEDMNGR
jgi:hypothetical protein